MSYISYFSYSETTYEARYHLLLLPVGSIELSKPASRTRIRIQLRLLSVSIGKSTSIQSADISTRRSVSLARRGTLLFSRR